MVDVIYRKQIVAILIVCILWYSSSSGNNVITKKLLSRFPYPMTITMVQLLSISVYSGPFLKFWGVRKSVDISWSYYMKIFVPLALGKFIVSVLTHVSIWKVPVSYAHTGLFHISSVLNFLCIRKFCCIYFRLIVVKATMPLFSVVLSRIILGEKQTNKVS